MARAEPLAADHFMLPKNVRDILVKARVQWLRNTEVQDLLQNHQKYGLKISREPPVCPPSGQLFLFNRRCIRFFRKDGHIWKKKADGKTVKEVHEKLKIGSRDALNCYYAHAENGLQRRCYWMLEGNDAIVLVHYLDVGQAGNLTRCATYPGASPPQQPGLQTNQGGDAVGQSAFAAAMGLGLLQQHADLNRLLARGAVGFNLPGSAAESLLNSLRQQLAAGGGLGAQAAAAAQAGNTPFSSLGLGGVGGNAAQELSPGASGALLSQLSQLVSAFSAPQLQAAGVNNLLAAQRAGSGPMAFAERPMLHASRAESAPPAAGSTLSAILAQHQSSLQAAALPFLAAQASGSTYAAAVDRLGSGGGVAGGGSGTGLLGLDSAGSGGGAQAYSQQQQLIDRLGSGGSIQQASMQQLYGQLVAAQASHAPSPQRNMGGLEGVNPDMLRALQQLSAGGLPAAAAALQQLQQQQQQLPQALLQQLQALQQQQQQPQQQQMSDLQNLEAQQLQTLLGLMSAANNQAEPQGGGGNGSGGGGGNAGGGSAAAGPAAGGSGGIGGGGGGGSVLNTNSQSGTLQDLLSQHLQPSMDGASIDIFANSVVNEEVERFINRSSTKPPPDSGAACTRASR